jgi:hypothetical protein
VPEDYRAGIQGFFYKELPRKPELLRENLTPMSTFITPKVATVPPFQKIEICIQQTHTKNENHKHPHKQNRAINISPTKIFTSSCPP